MHIVAKILKKVNEHSFDIFVVFCVACMAIISYNLGHIRALKKSPITIGENAAILGAVSGQQADVYRAGERAAAASGNPAPRDQRVVASKSSTSKKYHYSWCASGQRIKQENQIWFATAAAAEAAGYTLAANCQ